MELSGADDVLETSEDEAALLGSNELLGRVIKVEGTLVEGSPDEESTVEDSAEETGYMLV